MLSTRPEYLTKLYPKKKPPLTISLLHEDDDYKTKKALRVGGDLYNYCAPVVELEQGCDGRLSRDRAAVKIQMEARERSACVTPLREG